MFENLVNIRIQISLYAFRSILSTLLSRQPKPLVALKYSQPRKNSETSLRSNSTGKMPPPLRWPSRYGSVYSHRYSPISTATAQLCESKQFELSSQLNRRSQCQSSQRTRTTTLNPSTPIPSSISQLPSSLHIGVQTRSFLKHIPQSELTGFIHGEGKELSAN